MYGIRRKSPPPPPPSSPPPLRSTSTADDYLYKQHGGARPGGYLGDGDSTRGISQAPIGVCHMPLPSPSWSPAPSGVPHSSLQPSYVNKLRDPTSPSPVPEPPPTQIQPAANHHFDQQQEPLNKIECSFSGSTITIERGDKITINRKGRVYSYHTKEDGVLVWVPNTQLGGEDVDALTYERSISQPFSRSCSAFWERMVVP